MPPPIHSSPTVATIDFAALAHNLDIVRRHLTAPCEILAVVKADAYGHGAVAVAQRLLRLGVPRFGVATIQEGATLRDAGIQAPILVMGALLPNQLPDVIAHTLTPVVHDSATADALADLARSRPEPYPIHIKVDTGMGRLGLAPEAVLPLLQSPCCKGPLRVEGLMTHLADADGGDPGYTEAQIARFRTVVAQADAAGLSIPLLHTANSAAILCHPSSHFNLVRPGIMLYGYQSALRGQAAPDLHPVLTLSTTIVQINRLTSGESVGYNRAYRASRPSRIAILPIGYADGYNRALSSRGHVLLKGRQAPVVGRVCMDMTLVDVTDIPDAGPGDEAVLIGRQGTARITADDMAQWLGTIPYEVLCAIGPRVARVYR
ncbi:MAG: alanine racemase [Nitrospirae bacterium]|nr:MAG: alanine racemase [Nitrospirota bacterium]